MDFEHLLDFASPLHQHLATGLQAAAAAGKVIQDGSGGLNEVEMKGIGDLVSEVDRKADEAACRILTDASSIELISEELNSDAKPTGDTWIVDPLDASSAFLTNAGPQYPAVLIALREEDETSIGIVYFPLLDDWFFAVRGKGAWKLHASGGTQPTRLVCDTADPLNSVWVEMNHYGDAQFETEYFLQLRDRLRGSSGARLVTANVPNSGVAIRIAAGNSSLQAAIHDNNPENVKQACWDIAAPQLILEEAGGVFLNPEGKRSDPFKCEPIIVARSETLAREIVDLANRCQQV